MTRTTTITCDRCGNDLTDSGPMPDYRLVLRSESVPTTSHFRYAVLVEDPLPNDLHFCHEGCLVDWIVERTPRIHADPWPSP